MCKALPELIEPSPLQYFPRLSKLLGVEFWVKRDDLLPLVGGGNKVRKLLAIVKDVEAAGADVLITNGGVQSNHCRVTALLAAERGWGAVLALHGDTQHAAGGNLLLAKLCKADIRLAPADKIRETVERAMAEYSALGRVPYVIPGGGHCRAGAMAYYYAALELGAQWDARRGTPPNRIILASGTGATQGGLAAGLDKLSWKTALTGVSVARNSKFGRIAVNEVYEDLCRYIDSTDRRRIEFTDRWIEGGYERYSRRILDAISVAASTEGLILDATYTGKAFAALMDMRRHNEIQEGESVVFWHTGGLLNLTARPTIWSSYERH